MQRRRILALFLFFFSLGCIAFSQETEEAGETVMSLHEIDRYINDTNKRDFQKALLELNKYLAANPEQFDAVQRRFRKVLGSRDRYSELANELMRLIRESSEEDNENIDHQMKKLTDQILAIERNPGDDRLEIVKDTNYLVSVRQYSAIQNKTASLVQSGSYVQAGAKAFEGFDILHENFSAKFGEEKVSQDVDGAISNIKVQLEQFNIILERIKAAENAYVSAMNAGNVSLAQSALQNVQSVFGEYARIRNSVVDSGIVIQNGSDTVKRLISKNKKYSQTSDDDNFLKHGDEYPGLAIGVVFGWSENPDPDHGVLGVLDAVFNSSVEAMKKASLSRINQCAVQFSELSSVQAFRQNGTLPDKNELERIEAFGKCSTDVNDLYALLKNKDGKGMQEPFPDFNISVDYIVNVAVHTEKLVDDVIEIAGIKEKADVITAPEKFGEAELAGSDYTASLLSVSSEISSLVKTINSNSSVNSSWGEEYRNRLLKQLENQELPPAVRITSGVDVQDRIVVWEKIESTYNDYISAAGDYASDSIVEIYGRVASFYDGCGKDFVAKVEADSTQIRENITGSVVDGMTRKFSRVAVSEIAELNKYIGQTRGILAGGLKKLSGSQQNKFPEKIQGINESIAKLDEFTAICKGYSQEANELVRNADRNISEGDKILGNAQKFFRQKKFDEARTYANNAVDSYNDSLRFNYDEKLASESRKKIEDLLSQIAEQQKILIDQEVNALIAQANKEFNNDNYAQAQLILNRAQERWNVVFLDYENVEIQNMQKVVENALNANNGREVLPSDSLYIDVSQMLRSASQSFEKGKSLSKKGKAEESKEMFDEALQTLEVLRSLVPRNLAANKLRLEIQQFQDPAEFEINFANRVAQAKENASQAKKGTVDNEKLLQAYSDLCDLAEIKSDYPGLKATILELEYTLGKKTRPVDAKVQAEAKKLASEAQKLFGAGQYQQAYDRINKAIAKDGSSASFKTIRSSISARLQTKVYTRDANYADRYQEVVELISGNRYELAQGIILDMWKNPANRTDNLEKLKNRVERALGS